MEKKLCTVKGCVNEGKYCRSHIGLVVKKPKPIKPVSKERAQVNEKEYKPIRNAYLKKHPLCQAALIGCQKKAVDIHHSKGRIGKNLTDSKHFLAVCRSCHNLIEKNPAFAIQNGLSKSRLAKDDS